MTEPADAQSGEEYWFRNLLVCVFGSFTTLVAMTLLLPFLPLYIAQLGVRDRADVVQWSGIVFGATFFAAALVAPLWGRLADRYGRKIMMIRASLAMAVVMSLMGMAQNVWQLLALRLLAGFLGGYSSGSTILVATQTPKARAAWALGILASGVMAGNLAGPLIGGFLPPLIGIRATFLAAGAAIFVAFLATAFLIREARRPAIGTRKPKAGFAAVPDKRAAMAMLATGMLLMFANMSVEPIITIYVAQFEPASRVTIVSGFAMSAAALGAILAAPRLGRLADRIGHWRVIGCSLAACALLLIPQAFVTAGWQIVALRFVMGLALGGLLPCIAAVIRHSVPEDVVGGILGYSTSSQYVGQVAGPLAGGFVGGNFGMRSVFLGTAALMAAGSAFVFTVHRRLRKA
ncbi:MAG: MFS transporter [Rhodospirillales bacterium]|nr:MFS transporter [Rhodospirillales bacterium]